MRARKHNKEWLLFISAAIVLHLLLLLYIRPSFFAVFDRSRDLAHHAPSSGSFDPDAILFIPIEIEDPKEETQIERIVEEAETEKPIEPTDEQTFPKTATNAGTSVNVEEFLGTASQTLPQGAETDLVKIPPRPLEITWPDTRDLKHCLGHHIDVRIQVDADGEIIRAQVEDDDLPEDCLQAALDSARRIVFAPGKVNGRPARMWTKIRIDFRRKQ
jgi:hypothetical protein